jgi:hypothetical protein
VRRSWQRVLERQLRRREALTVVELTERWRREHAVAAASG